MSLAEKLQGCAVGTILSAALTLGHNLNIFQALAEVGSKEKPAKAADVAEKANCKPRYVDELLCLLATADVIGVNEKEEFWIEPENVDLLCTNNMAMVISANVIEVLGPFKELTKVMKKEGPLGLTYSQFDGFYQIISKFSEALHKESFISEFVPRIEDGIEKRLAEGGLLCLDVGCGSGFHSHLLAKAFPKSNFMGIDITLEAILEANQRRIDNDETMENLAFSQMDAAALDKDWDNHFDVVLIIDACHDQMRPDLCLKEVYRVLKPGGVFAMLEPKGSGNVYIDKKELGPLATLLYGFSVFHCLPVGSNSPDAICAGSAWGREMAQKLLKEAGFEKIEIVQIPKFNMNQLYLCHK